MPASRQGSALRPVRQLREKAARSAADCRPSRRRLRPGMAHRRDHKGRDNRRPMRERRRATRTRAGERRAAVRWRRSARRPLRRPRQRAPRDSPAAARARRRRGAGARRATRPRRRPARPSSRAARTPASRREFEAAARDNVEPFNGRRYRSRALCTIADGPTDGRRLTCVRSHTPTSPPTGKGIP